MPQNNMLDKTPETSMGMTRRGYDKYGKRMMMSSMKSAGDPGSQNPVKHMMPGRMAGKPKGVSSNQKRTMTY